MSDSYKKSTLSYALPASIRQYYDGVTTGEEGEYEEGNAIKSKR